MKYLRSNLYFIVALLRAYERPHLRLHADALARNTSLCLTNCFSFSIHTKKRIAGKMAIHSCSLQYAIMEFQANYYYFFPHTYLVEK